MGYPSMKYDAVLKNDTKIKFARKKNSFCAKVFSENVSLLRDVNNNRWKRLNLQK